MPYDAANRLMSLTTPLGENALLLAGLSGTEAISRLFSFNLELLTEQGPIDFSSIIGQNVTITIALAGSHRYFNGLVSRFGASGSGDGFARYQMEVVPWTWMLTRFADCRIFHNKTVVDILRAVFNAHGFQDYDLSLNRDVSATGILRSVS